MTHDTLFVANMVNDTDQTLRDWIEKESTAEPSLPSSFVNADQSYLLAVKKEIKSATLKILRKHQAIKQKEFEKIK